MPKIGGELQNMKFEKKVALLLPDTLTNTKMCKVTVNLDYKPDHERSSYFIVDRAFLTAAPLLHGRIEERKHNDKCRHTITVPIESRGELLTWKQFLGWLRRDLPLLEIVADHIQSFFRLAELAHEGKIIILSKELSVFLIFFYTLVGHVEHTTDSEHIS